MLESAKSHLNVTEKVPLNDFYQSLSIYVLIHYFCGEGMAQNRLFNPLALREAPKLVEVLT